MSKVIKGVCFDKNLYQKEDLDFFFISSKDNIVIAFNNQLKCYNRKDITKSSDHFIYYGKELVQMTIDGENIILDKKSFNHLNYRDYSIYNLVKTSKSYRKYGNLYELEYHKRLDFLRDELL